MNRPDILTRARQFATFGPGSISFTEEALLLFCSGVLADAGVDARPEAPAPFEERHLDAQTGQWKPWRASAAQRSDMLRAEKDIEFRFRPRLDRAYSHESRVKGSRCAWLPISQETYLQQEHGAKFEFRAFTGYQEAPAPGLAP